MPYVVGVDEAGYGPNLGPLVISATVWHVPARKARQDLYELLSETVVPQPPPAKSDDARLALGDSKALYNPARGLSVLERGLLAVLAAAGVRPCSWLEVWQALCPERDDDFALAPWHVGYDAPLPMSATPDEVIDAAAGLARGLKAAKVRVHAVRSCAVFPDRWNRLIEQYGNKSEALSNLTLALLGRTIADLDDHVFVVCDKHGGRNCYGAPLQHNFPETLVEVYGEGADESTYRWGPKEHRIEVRFRPRAETFLPTAVASMTSKYLRELAMRAFNDFWRAHLPDLKPTAGYYRDAYRFKEQIGALQATLGIDDAILWRIR